MPQAGLNAAAQAWLFDLDGTLIDSAPDLAGTANDMRVDRGQAALAYELLRPHAGSGARGMLGAAFGLLPAHDGYLAMRDEFHDRYEARMLRHTRLFGSVAELLARLDQQGVDWGIVTNKSLRFAKVLVDSLAPLSGAKVLIGGDSTPHTKPHPEPLLEAARRLRVSAAACVYVGDDPRDMQAARAAGMGAWAAAWGYLGVHQPVHSWGADRVLGDVEEMMALLQSTDLT